jgi:hypothetical protein
MISFGMITYSHYTHLFFIVFILQNYLFFCFLQSCIFERRLDLIIARKNMSPVFLIIRCSPGSSGLILMPSHLRVGPSCIFLLIKPILKIPFLDVGNAVRITVESGAVGRVLS